MYSKLLKYDWRATRGMLGLLCAISLGAALAGGGTMRYLIWASDYNRESTLLIVVNVMAMIACFLSICVCGVAGLFLHIWRFYKSRFTDEGFVTFTLPVTTHQILLSSLLNTVIGMVLLGLTICLCVPVWLLVGFSGVEGFFPALWELLPQIPKMFSEIFRKEEMKYFWAMLVNIPVGFLAEIVVLMLSVTIGSVIAKKHKILASVGCYYGINLVLSFVSGICSLAMAFAAEANAGWIMGLFGSNSVILLIVAVGGYFLMHFLADKKLNLT